MSNMQPALVRDLIERARAIARRLDAQVPQASVYRVVLAQLTEVESAMAIGANEGFQAARTLGVLAVRELDGMAGAPGELGQLLFSIRDALRRLAGLPYYS